jgi:hypothetical protein
MPQAQCQFAFGQQPLMQTQPEYRLIRLGKVNSALANGVVKLLL